MNSHQFEAELKLFLNFIETLPTYVVDSIRATLDSDESISWKIWQAARSQPAKSPEAQFEEYVASLIANNPDVRGLGQQLALWLDEDRFNTIEPILTGI